MNSLNEQMRAGLIILSLSMCLQSCSPSPIDKVTSVKTTAADATSSTPTSPKTQEHTDRLAEYRSVLDTLKATTNPPVDNAYNVVTMADTAAFQERMDISGASSASTTSTNTQSYSGSSREPSVDEINISRRYASLQDKLEKGDSRGALWDAGVMLEHAKNTRDPEKIRAAQQIHDTLYERAGGYGIGRY